MPHIIPFAGRLRSGSVNQNLLWQDGDVFLMNNHRAALWCRQQKVDLYSQPHSLMHIDRRYDALSAGIHVRNMPDLRATSAQSYLSDLLKTSAGRIPRFRWDNVHLSAAIQRPACDAPPRNPQGRRSSVISATDRICTR